MLDNCFNYIKFIANILLALCRCFHIVPMIGYCYLIKLLKVLMFKTVNVCSSVSNIIILV